MGPGRGLFDSIERLAHSDELTRMYDGTDGFPTNIDSNADVQTFDDELRLTVTRFEDTSSP